MAHPYLENSIILSKFINAADSSVVIRLVNVLGNWFRGSIFYRIYKKAASKEPVYSHSLTNKVIKHTTMKIDRVAGLVHDRVSAAFNSGIFGRLCMEFAAESRSNPCRMMAAAALSFCLGYSLIVVAKGLFSMRSLFIMAAMAVFSLVLFAVGEKWRSILSNSVFVRFLKYIID